MAYYLVGKVGLSGSDKLGLMALLGRRGRTPHESALSEVTSSALDAEARRLVNQQYKATTALVRSKVRVSKLHESQIINFNFYWHFTVTSSCRF